MTARPQSRPHSHAEIVIEEMSKIDVCLAHVAFWWLSKIGAVDRKFRVWSRRGLILVVFCLVIGAVCDGYHLYNLGLAFSSVVILSLFLLFVGLLWFAKQRVDHGDCVLKYRTSLEGTVYVPGWAQATWPKDDWVLPPPESKQMVPPANPKAKIAVLSFLYDDLHFKELWTEFFRKAVDPGSGDPQFIAVMHCSKPGKLSELRFAHQVVETVETDYGSAVPAHQAVIKQALKDPLVMGGVFVSAACVPVKPFQEVRTQLMGGKQPPSGRSVLTYDSNRFDKVTHW